MSNRAELLDIAKQAIAEGDEVTANAAMDAAEKLPQATPTTIEPQNNSPELNNSSPDQSYLSKVGQNLGNEAAGLVRGAGSIGSTLLWPVDKSIDLIKNDRNGLPSRNEERRQLIDDGLQTMGANPDSGFYKGGKLVGEIAGTAGIGGAIAAPIKSAPYLAKLAQAIESGGMSAGTVANGAAFGQQALNLGTRALGGAITGGASAGIVDPDSAGLGAAIGGALPPAVKTLGAIGKGVASGTNTLIANSLGGLTGTGDESVRAAFNAGKEGSQSFLDNMRGKVDFSDVVDNAKQALSTMRQQRGEAYRSGMIDIKGDASIIPFDPIRNTMDKISGMGSYKGVQINKNASTTVDELKGVVDQWSQLNPNEYHTPEGLDALKQAVGDIRDGTQHGTAARRASDEVYNSVKNQVVNQAPTYAKVMSEYSSASKTLSETEKALSLGDKTSQDTAVRKLQSLLRNNAQTNYGNRLAIAKNLESAGGVDLMSSIAGQSMNSWMPRGMTGAIQKAGVIPTAAFAPSALLAAPLASPRIVGESAYFLGNALGKTKKALTSQQSIKLANMLNQQNTGITNARNRANPDLQSLLYRAVPVIAADQ